VAHPIDKIATRQLIPLLGGQLIMAELLGRRPDTVTVDFRDRGALSNGVLMSDLAEEYSHLAREAEINVLWACDADLRFYWKETAAAYRRLATAINARASMKEVNRDRAA
jgi:hypothetical protein